MAKALEEPRSPKGLVEPVLLGLAVLVFSLLTHHHWQQVCDDAFIAFRYADHVAQGWGPVWNRGEAVEGFSSPLWLGILVVGKAVRADLRTWSGVLGVIFSGLCLVFVHRCAFALAQRRPPAAAACLACALIYPLYYWAPAGLETTLFATLVTAAAWSLVACSNRLWALVAALLGVVRPEGPFLMLGLLGLARLAHGRAAIRIATVSLAVTPALGWLAFRLSFYGEWLPNTYYAKATGVLLHRLQSGFAYAGWALLALAVTGAALWLARIADRKSLAVAAFLALVLVPVVGSGGDWMWHGRMLLPALPALAALAVTAVARAPAGRRPVQVLALVMAGAPFLPSPALVADALLGKRMPETSYQEGTMVAAAFTAARAIAANYSPDALVAVNHAGALPYRLPNPVLDMTGLCNHHIAHQVAGGVHQKFDPAYVLARKPRLVVLNSRVRPSEEGGWYHPGYWAGETALALQPEFQRLYRPVKTYWEWRWVAGVTSYILLFERVAPATDIGGVY